MTSGKGDKTGPRGRAAISSWTPFLLLILGMGGCSGESPPPTQEILPLIKAAWTKERPSLALGESVLATFQGKTNPPTVIVKLAKVDKPRSGRFVQPMGTQDTSGPSMAYLPVAGTLPPLVPGMEFGPTLTYWPVTARIEATYQQQLSVNEQKERVEEREYIGYLYRDKDNGWKVTFLSPKDETPFYKFW